MLQLLTSDDSSLAPRGYPSVKTGRLEWDEQIAAPALRDADRKVASI